MNFDRILLSHGSGGLLTNNLIKDVILKYINNKWLNKLNDSALIETNSNKICFTTDSYVINPIFFLEVILALYPFMVQLMILQFQEQSHYI